MEFFIAGLIIAGILGWITKLIYKGRMQRGLGRKVEDHELTSINTWMDALPEDKANAREQK
jgi:hypothetical protein